MINSGVSLEGGVGLWLGMELRCSCASLVTIHHVRSLADNKSLISMFEAEWTTDVLHSDVDPRL